MNIIHFMSQVIRGHFDIANIVDIGSLDRGKTNTRAYIKSLPTSVWSHYFGEIDHEIIFTAILLPSPDSRRVVVSYK